MSQNKFYIHVNSRGKIYYLHHRTVNLKGNRQQTIYYFAATPGENVSADVPEGFKVIESSTTGLPILKRA